MDNDNDDDNEMDKGTNVSPGNPHYETVDVRYLGD